MLTDYECEGPSSTFPEVWAWSDSYIPFDSLTPKARLLQEELRIRLRQVCPPLSDDLLYAAYSGPKHAASDVENLLLYNIDQGGGCFRHLTARGARFELAACRRRRPPSKRAWACSYQYALAPLEKGFVCWKPRKELASFADVDLGAFPNRKRLAQTWLALRRSQVKVARIPLARDAPFAVRISLETPLGVYAAPGLVKELIDGVVSSFQAHRDHSILPEVAARLTTAVEATPQEIANGLLDGRRAVLGTVDRLVYPYRNDVKWNPSDHLCVAGEVLISQTTTLGWKLSGAVVEVASR